MRDGLRESARRLLRQQVAPRLPVRVSDRIDTVSSILSVDGRVARMRGQLRRLALGRGPIIVGPWLSEVGFELLYWIPFLNWATQARPIDPTRLIVVSRGGTQRWYQHLAHQYVDVLEQFSPDEFRAGNEKRIRDQNDTLKHMAISDFDRRIIARVQHATGHSSVEVLHPSLMYDLFTPFFRRRSTVRLIERFTHYRRLELGQVIRAELPPNYVAVKFYYSPSFPDTPENHGFVDSLLAQLCSDSDVVLLNSGLILDDHRELAATKRSRIHSIDHLMTPSNNLDVQTQVIAGATAFVGTYGGLSYLAPFYGVNSVAFYSDPTQFVPHHLSLAQGVFHTLGGARFTALSVRDLDLLRESRVLSPGGVAV